MDIFQQTLHKLYETTGGKESNTVDFVDLVKKLGLNSYYHEIFKRLSDEGWIAETLKQGFVGITPFGIRAAQTLTVDNKSQQNLIRQTNQAANLAEELTEILRTCAQNGGENLKPVTEKFAELEAKIREIKSGLA